jgi:hypothetical protein
MDTRKNVITLDNFRDMQGELGAYYLTEATFRVIVRLRDSLVRTSQNALSLGVDSDHYVTLEDYIIYSDIAYNGTPDEKIMLSFMMFDSKG